MNTKSAPKTVGEYIARDLANPGNQKMLVAIEHDRRQARENERLHPLSGHTTTEFRPDVPAKHIDTSAVAINYPINPTA